MVTRRYFFTFTFTMKQEQPFEEPYEDLKDLIERFDAMQQGESIYLEEDAFAQIIDYYSEKEDLERGHLAADVGMEQFPYSADMQFRKANLFNLSGQFGKALELLEQAESLSPSDGEAFIYKVDAYVGLGDPDRAFAILKENLRAMDRVEREELLVYFCDSVEGKPEYASLAFDCMKMILEEHSKNEDALVRVSEWATAAGRDQESLALNLHILNEDPYNKLAWFNAGVAYAALEDLDRSVDAYDYALVIDEGFNLARQNKAEAYAVFGEYDEAIKTLDYFIKRDEADGAVYELLAYCYDHKEHFPRSRFYYLKAIGLAPEPESSFFYYRIGLTYMMEDNWLKAISFLQKAVQLDPDSYDYQMVIAQCYGCSGDLAVAMKHFRRAAKIRPRKKHPYLAAVVLLYNDEQYENALEELDKAAAALPSLRELSYYRAVIYLAMGYTKEALLLMEEGLQTDPDTFDEIYKLEPDILRYDGVVALLSRYNLMS